MSGLALYSNAPLKDGVLVCVKNELQFVGKFIIGSLDEKVIELGKSIFHILSSAADDALNAALDQPRVLKQLRDNNNKIVTLAFQVGMTAMSWYCSRNLFLLNTLIGVSIKILDRQWSDKIEVLHNYATQTIEYLATKLGIYEELPEQADATQVRNELKDRFKVLGKALLGGFVLTYLFPLGHTLLPVLTGLVLGKQLSQRYFEKRDNEIHQAVAASNIIRRFVRPSAARLEERQATLQWVRDNIEFNHETGRYSQRPTSSERE